MPLKIVRNDITKMDTEAIVNTAGENAEVGSGCETAIYKAAGYDKLLKARKKFGHVAEGEVFITPGFDLKAKYIIHAVSPFYIDGGCGEVEKLRSCYRKSLKLAKENGIGSMAFPLISTGSYGFPRAYGLRIAMDEINAFLLDNEMDVYIVVFDTASTELAEKLHPQIQAFIDHDYVCEKRKEEYGDPHFGSVSPGSEEFKAYAQRAASVDRRLLGRMLGSFMPTGKKSADKSSSNGDKVNGALMMFESAAPHRDESAKETIDLDYEEPVDEEKLDERIRHLKDPFGVYLLYLSDRKKISLTVLESTAWLSKHVVHKVRKFTETYKPDKRTAFQFCVGLELSLDDTKDLLSRAGYTISDSILEDKIWEFYIENEHYDIMDISDSLERYGLKPIIDF